MKKEMDLILWRHAEALDGMPDLARPLSEHGKDQARRMAKWLEQHAPKDLRLMVSPAVRTRQTAACFRERMEISEALAPGAFMADVLNAADWPAAGGIVLIVGHQPTLGQVGAFLLSGVASPWALKKGAVWWLTHRVRRDESETILRIALTPDMI